jgi:hypothetical protein
VIAGGKGTAADKFRALDAAGARTVKSPADLGKAMAELLVKSRAKAAKLPAPGPNVLIIEPRLEKHVAKKASAKKSAPKVAKKAVKPKAKAVGAAKKSAPKKKVAPKKKKAAKARRAK